MSDITVTIVPEIVVSVVVDPTPIVSAVVGIQGPPGADSTVPGPEGPPGVFDATTATPDSSPLDTDEAISLRTVALRTTWLVIKGFFKTYFDTLYIWAAGKAGGQTIIGGTAAGEDLTLSSTSNATKGMIVAGPLEVDEVAGSVGTTGTFNIPLSTATTGQIRQNGGVLLHTYGTRNLFIGKDSGNFTTSGTGNNFGIGELSLFSLTTGYQNTGIGPQSLTSMTSGANNFGLGAYTLTQLTSGTNNVAVGTTAMQGSSGGISASSNVAIGASAMRWVLNAQSNIAIGDTALQGASSSVPITGNYNIGIGSATIGKASSAQRNIGIGWNSLNSITTGSTNTAIGMYSGDALLTESGNVFIGYGAGRYATGSNKLIINNVDTDTIPLISGDFATGMVGIGTGSPTSALHVVGLPIYANNATAITGGLTVGAFYRTGADPDLVCVVH